MKPVENAHIALYEKAVTLYTVVKELFHLMTYGSRIHPKKTKQKIEWN